MSCLLHVQEYMYEVTQIVIIRPATMPLYFSGKVTIEEYLLQGACRVFSKGFFRCTLQFRSISTINQIFA